MGEAIPSYEIRRMQPEDIAAVVAIERLASPSPWSERQFRGELANACATVDLLIVGRTVSAYVCSWLIADELEIQNVATAPDFRQRGCAETLLRHVLRRAAENGARRAFLEVRAGNTAARRLYEKLHFACTGVRERYYPDNEDAILMARDLPASTG